MERLNHYNFFFHIILDNLLKTFMNDSSFETMRKKEKKKTIRKPHFHNKMKKTKAN